MTSKDQELYQSITLLLNNTAPKAAKYLKLDAYLGNEEDLSCELQFFYIDEADDEYWFLPENKAETCHMLAEMVIELREFFVSQNQAPWKSLVCLFGRDNGKMQFQFNYD